MAKKKARVKPPYFRIWIGDRVRPFIVDAVLVHDTESGVDLVSTEADPNPGFDKIFEILPDVYNAGKLLFRLEEIINYGPGPFVANRDSWPGEHHPYTGEWIPAIRWEYVPAKE